MKKPYKFNERAVVINAMRRSFRIYPPYKECLEAAKSAYFIRSKKGKSMRRVHYECNLCHKKFSRKDICVDHNPPVIDIIKGFESYDVYAKRLYCSLTSLQVLCNSGSNSCHKVKTKYENSIRKKVKNEN